MAILGIDEVGRGPWAGPLVMGAVVLDRPSDPIWQDLADSKKLTPKRRQQQNELILARAAATGLGWVPANELDQLGLAAALSLCAQRAVSALVQLANKSGHQPLFDEIIIDGTVNFLADTPYASQVTVLKKADSLIKEVSAASIIAKVARDNYMVEIAQQYPEYGFAQHVGYGTAAHRQALLEHGPCPEHRYSFRPVADLVQTSPTQDPSEQTTPYQPASTTAAGRRAEQVVADHLESLGHSILARNFRTRSYEIDIVSATAEHIYFTEVKYRKSFTHGAPIEAVDHRKRQQMEFAARAFYARLAKALHRPLESLPAPVLAVAEVAGADFSLGQWLPLN